MQEFSIQVSNVLIEIIAMFVKNLYIKILQEMSSLFFEKLDNSSQIFPKYDTTIFRHFLQILPKV